MPLTPTELHHLHTIGRLLTNRQSPAGVAPEETNDMVKLAVRHGLGPMLMWTLKEQGINLQEAGWLPLVESARTSAARYLLVRNTQSEVHTALQRVKIPTIWLKGYCLANTVYPQPALRPMVDLDVLVPFKQREAALEVVETLGYHAYVPEIFDGSNDLSHHYHLRSSGPQHALLELHYLLLGWNEKLLNQEELGWFWRNTHTYEAPNGLFTSLTPEAHLLYLSAHAVLQHGPSEFTLRMYYDLHRLIHYYPDLKWEVVIQQAARLQWSAALIRALSLSQDFFDTPLNPAVIASLQGQSRPTDFAPPADSFDPFNRLEGTARQLSELPRSRQLIHVFRLIFPPASYMRYRYRPSSSWRLPGLYLYRWWDITRETARTLRKRIRTKK